MYLMFIFFKHITFLSNIIILTQTIFFFQLNCDQTTIWYTCFGNVVYAIMVVNRVSWQVLLDSMQLLSSKINCKLPAPDRVSD